MVSTNRLVSYCCTPLVEVSQPRSPLSLFVAKERIEAGVAPAAFIQGETGRHLSGFEPQPDCLSGCSRRGLGKARYRIFPCLFSVPGSNQEISGTGFRYLAEMILASSQKPVLSQFEFQRWVRSGHSLTRRNGAGAPEH
jgi:hypothetical protein